MYVLECRTASALTRGLFLCLFSSCEARSAETVRHESTYIFVFLTRNNEFINDDKKRLSLHIVPVSHSLVLRSADHVTIDY